MTNDMMKLRALAEKTSDSDLLREMIGFAAEWLCLRPRSATDQGRGVMSLWNVVPTTARAT
ncbi:hypothetical protein [Mesorhizobium sp. M0998]|uniref:hypothetical protein n=1 Tax=Mesorhizobium sp. M0998 TaxID=2957044 RepID=UPI00333A88FE